MTSTTHLAPLLHVPTKKTDEVDFAPSFRAYIQSTYQDDPDKYANEIATLNRLRQDTRGAGKDVTGRDILYRYYGQLELLDLRFPVEEKAVKVLFTWYDAFSQKPISQYSIAYEKACTIFNIAATCSSIAALQNRFEPAGLKTAYNYFQAAAGLFAYINDNFLHAPSVDLSRDSIKTLVELMLAQAQECMIEKMVQEKKKGALVAKLAAQTAHMYGNVLDGLTNDAVSSQFQKAWVDLVKIKAKHFQAVSYYHKSFALEADGKSGENVAHLTHAEALAKEANSLATAFTKSHSSFTTAVQTPASSSSSSSGQPTAAGAALLEAAKADLSLITERKNVATKDNDLIYHEAVPNVDTLPAIEKLNTVKPITFAEICTNGQADIPKIIGADIFQRLIPLSVHESSSLYSEEKAKVLRAEQGRVEAANGELQAMMESMNLIPTIDKLKRQIKGGGGFGDGSRLPDEVMRWQEEVYREERGGSGNSTDEMVAALEGLKQRVRGELDETGLMLDREQHECEGMRVKYMDQWTQEPSATLNSHIRQDIRQNRESFEKALSTDQALFARINESKRDVSSLKRPIEEVESIFAEQTISVGPRKEQQVNLIDADTTGSGGLGQLGEQVLLEKLDGILMRLRALKKERLETLEDLKSKLHADDISSLLLLNKNKETQIFQSELSKFKPLQSRLSANIQQHQQLLQDLTNEFGKLRESSQAMKSLDLTEKRKADLLKQWRRSYDLWREARDGLKRGMQFYSDLSELVTSLRSTAATFADRRSEERNQLAKKIEAEQAERGQQALREQLHRLSVSGGGTPSAHGSPAGTPVSATPGYAPAPYAGPVPNPPVPQSAPVPAGPSYPPQLPSSPPAYGQPVQPFAPPPPSPLSATPSGASPFVPGQPYPPSQAPQSASWQPQQRPPYQQPYAGAPPQIPTSLPTPDRRFSEHYASAQTANHQYPTSNLPPQARPLAANVPYSPYQPAHPHSGPPLPPKLPTTTPNPAYSSSNVPPVPPKPQTANPYPSYQQPQQTSQPYPQHGFPPAPGPYQPSSPAPQGQYPYQAPPAQHQQYAQPPAPQQGSWNASPAAQQPAPYTPSGQPGYGAYQLPPHTAQPQGAPGYHQSPNPAYHTPGTQAPPQQGYGHSAPAPAPYGAPHQYPPQQQAYGQPPYQPNAQQQQGQYGNPQQSWGTSNSSLMD